MTEKKRITINGIRVQYKSGGADYDAEAIHKAASRIYKKLGVKPYNLKISKKSIDARREISFVYTVYAEIDAKREITEDAEIKLFSEPSLPETAGEEKLMHRPVIVGFGPAGIFAALLLAKRGYAPIVFERGSSVADRIRAVDRFINDGVLDTNTNIQFGAGGAGTFSDGKLTTRISDPKISYVLRTLCELGAPEEILYKAKPHIGTDILRKVIENADCAIRELGGEIRYNSTVSDITDTSFAVDGERMAFDVLVLACGHSARDTYGELIRDGFAVEAKPFSVGVRAEHLQADVDSAMFGIHAGDPTLGHAEYQLSHRIGERACYTFCMCPGGVVVPSSSEEAAVVTNGMSYHARDGRNANAAVCVSVNRDDFGGDPRSAIEFQRTLERRAYTVGGGDYFAPMQTVGDFLAGKRGTDYSKVIPTYRDGKVKLSNFDEIFPPFVCEMLRAGLHNFGRKIKGYDEDHVTLTGVETRTSAPVRILRGDDCRALGHRSIYPCGEGAGYAGGIVSAAVDGLRVALSIMSQYAPYCN